MRNPPTLSAWITLVFAALACALPGQTTELLPESPSPSETPTDGPEGPRVRRLSLSQAVTAMVESGERTEAEAVAAALGYLVGEIPAGEALGEQSLMSDEGTGVILRAQRYLAGSEVDPAAASEIQRLLSILVPSREVLDRISRPAHAGAGPGLARAPEAPDGLQTQCQSLWADGFVSPLSVTCLEYVEVESGGNTYRLYYPAYWAAADPRRASMDDTQSALEDSLRLFNLYGPHPIAGTDIVFTELAFRDPDGTRRTSVWAAADSHLTAGRCHVGVFPSAAGLSGAGFLQTISHELFHCYQFTNLPGQVRGPNFDSVEWWVEGTAEFFGSAVYPSGNDEWRYISDFDGSASWVPITKHSYDNNFFFQYLAVQAGMAEAGVLSLLRSLPEDGGGIEQQNRLAEFSGIQEILQEFGRAYQDRKLQDLGGGTVPVNPEPEEEHRFGVGGLEEPFEVLPFVVGRHKLIFADHARFQIQVVPVDGDGAQGARPSSAVGGWGDLPAELETECGDPEYILVLTSAVAFGETPYTFNITTQGEEVEEGFECDRCLLGEWELFNPSYLGHSGGLWDIIVASLPSEGAEASPTSVFGRMSIAFSEDGVANGVQDGWGIAGVVTREGKRVESQVSYSGSGQANWRVEVDEAADQHYLFFDAGAFDLFAQMVFQGLPLSPRPTGGSNDPIFLSSPQPYVCTDTTLAFNAEDPLGAIWFSRLTPPLEP